MSIRMPQDIYTRLDALAKLTGRTKTYYISEALIEHMEDIEDLYLAEKELIEVRAGRSKLTPIEDVVKELGLEG